MFPRSATGRSSLVPPPPWHYSGQMLTIEYRTDPAAVAELLPPPLEPAADDPGAVAVIWADWQSCSDTFEELLDPVRSQYMETFVVVRCSLPRRDVQPLRLHLGRQGLRAWCVGTTRATRRSSASCTSPDRSTSGVAGPRLEPGGRFGATCSAYGRRLIDATFTITGTAQTAGFVNGHPMIHSPRLPGHRERRHRLAARAGHDARLRRRGRAVLRRARRRSSCTSRRSRSSPAWPRSR